jgi:glycosidase
VGAQDRDGDGVCAPSCVALPSEWRGQPCADDTGVALITERRCVTRVSYAPGGAERVFIAGAFNDWDPEQDALSLGPDGRLFIDLELPPGDHPYKLIDADADRWFEDPANPLRQWVDGVRNSRLRVADCEHPTLRLTATPRVNAGRVTITAQYVDGATGVGLGPAGVIVTRDGVPIATTWDPQTGAVVVDDDGPLGGKRIYRFTATDAEARVASPLYVPVWIEEAPFDWRDASLYFVLTDRFADGDPGNNTPVPGVETAANWQGGDFAGLRAQIEAGYFDALGINAIWLSSISQNTQGAWPGDFEREYTAYHGYWPTSTGWRDGAELAGVEPIEPHFGDLASFRALVRAAHDRGIRVLVDFVANHVHADSPWWQTARGSVPPVFHEPAVDCKSANWTEPIRCWFAPYLPDLEYKNVDTMNAVVDHAWWLVRETGIDGFRLDAVKHMVDDVGRAIRGTLDARLRYDAQRFYLVGETFTGEDGHDVIAAYIGRDQLDGQFDFPLYWRITDVFLRETRDLRALLQDPIDFGPDAIMSTFLGNHDVCRALSQASGAFDDPWCSDGKARAWDDPPALPDHATPFQRLRLAWTFLLTTPGVPLFYYGDELGFPGAGDPDNRRFMQFDDLSAHQEETLEYVRRLGRLRRAHPALRRGVRETLTMSDDGLFWVYRMAWGLDRVIVALNRGEAPRVGTLPVSGLGLADGLTGAALSTDPNEHVHKVTVGPRAAVILVEGE